MGKGDWNTTLSEKDYLPFGIPREVYSHGLVHSC